MEYRVCRNNPAPYNDLNGKISLLGLGTMRLPLRDAADQTSIDEEKAQEIFDYAYAHGVNYFDTAYPYHGGMSEKFCGKALTKYPRASYHLASKLPGWLLKCDEDVPRIFNEQLANCRTDYFDFYLVHSVHESSWSNYVKYHAYDQLNKLRKAGKIKRLGFSFHGSAEQLPESLLQAIGILYSCSSIILTGTISRAAKNTSCAPLPGCRSSLWSRCAAGC